jgi:hypothetical protein
MASLTPEERLARLAEEEQEANATKTRIKFERTAIRREVRLAEEKAQKELFEKRIQALDFEWNSDFTKSRKVLGAEESSGSVSFYFTEWADTREDITLTREDGIALRDWLNKVL